MCLLCNGRVAFGCGSVIVQYGSVVVVCVSVRLICGSVVLKLKDECNNQGFDSFLIGFKNGALGGAQVPFIDKKSSSGSVLGSTGSATI